MKKAFSLIELVMVIVVVGIIAIVAIPRFQRDNLQEAADQILSHIRYTQQLAMLDNKFKPDDETWYKGMWQIRFNRDKFTNNNWSYSVFSDRPSYTGNPDPGDIAKDPQNPKKLLSAGFSGTLLSTDERANSKMNLEKTFGIKGDNGIVFSGGCSGRGSPTRLAFDNIGRPFFGNISNSEYYMSNLMKTNCIITISDGIKKAEITVEAETGYSYISSI